MAFKAISDFLDRKYHVLQFAYFLNQDKGFSDIKDLIRMTIH
ncbi:hypothetical protein [Pedobacter sp. WC2423]